MDLLEGEVITINGNKVLYSSYSFFKRHVFYFQLQEKTAKKLADSELIETWKYPGVANVDYGLYDRLWLKVKPGKEEILKVYDNCLKE